MFKYILPLVFSLGFGLIPEVLLAKDIKGTGAGFEGTTATMVIEYALQSGRIDVFLYRLKPFLSSEEFRFVKSKSRGSGTQSFSMKKIGNRTYKITIGQEVLMLQPHTDLGVMAVNGRPYPFKASKNLTALWNEMVLSVQRPLPVNSWINRIVPKAHAAGPLLTPLALLSFAILVALDGRQRRIDDPCQDVKGKLRFCENGEAVGSRMWLGVLVSGSMKLIMDRLPPICEMLKEQLRSCVGELIRTQPKAAVNISPAYREFYGLPGKDRDGKTLPERGAPLSDQ